MTDAIAAALGAVVLATALAAGFGVLGTRGPHGGRRRVPVATIVALVIVGVPTLLQFTVAPALVDALQRDRERILSGEVWRIATSLVVQDGGVAGAIVNLLALALVGVVAEWTWGAARWVLIALASGLVAQVWGFVVQPVGAGNSVVVYGLAASLAVAALAWARGPARILAIVSLAGAAVLLGIGDLHGGAAVVGAALGGILVWTEARRGSGTAKPDFS